MPGSIRENDQFVRDFVAQNGIHYVLDVGTGQGTYSDLLKPYIKGIDGIEVWLPYVRDYALELKYDNLWVKDARQYLDTFGDDMYDLVIFGDVLEHMSQEESSIVWNEASRIAKWGLISVPIVHYPQGAEGGNPYEVHVQEHLTPEHIRATFGPFDHEALYPWTGTFIKRF